MNEAPTVSIVSPVTVDETAVLPQTVLETIMTNDVDGDMLTVTCVFDPDDGKFAGSCDSAGGNGEYHSSPFSISFLNIQILFF